MILASGIVAQQHRGSIVHGNQDIHGTVVIEVSEGQTSRRKLPGENRSAVCADVLQARTRVLKKQHGLAVGDPRIDFVDEIVRMAVGDQQVEVAVVIVVEKLQTPAAHRLRGPGNTGRSGDIFKRLVVFVVIHPIELVIQIRHKKIHPSILGQISGIHSHARPRFSSLPVRHSRREADLFETPSGAIGEKEIRGSVVGDEEIEEAVVVDVRGDDAPSFAGIACYARLLVHVREGAVAVVVEEPARHGIEDAGVAVFVDARESGYVGRITNVVLQLAEIDEPADEKIQASVVVVIKPHHAGGPTGSGDTCLFGDICEGTVPIVAIQNAAAVLIIGPPIDPPNML